MTGTTPLDLPPGPLVSHLQAAHRIIESAQINPLTLGPDAVELHAYHCQQMARWTAYDAAHGRPPAPAWPRHHREDVLAHGLPAGWAFLAYTDPDAEHPIAGITHDDRVVVWSSTDLLVRTFVETINKLMENR